MVRAMGLKISIHPDNIFIAGVEIDITLGLLHVNALSGVLIVISSTCAVINCLGRSHSAGLGGY